MSRVNSFPPFRRRTDPSALRRSGGRLGGGGLPPTCPSAGDILPHKGGGERDIPISGFVSLVGAGPGDPKLITLRGKEALEACNVVIYDHLIDPAVLNYATCASKIYVGKHGEKREPSTPQKSIESMMVELARRGKHVVRLKGGDPFVFGRGGEEALHLAQAGIPYEVIPGVTSGIAAPAYAGIPLTHRGLASEVTFITAHEDPVKKRPQINWKVIARLEGTIVMYMGLKTLPRTVRHFLRYGKTAHTPVTVIRWGTTPQQKVVEGTLETIVRDVEKAQLTSPVLAVIGKVNRLRKFLRWFEAKPLFGKTVLVTRPQKQASKLSEALASQGARVLEVPTIEISPARDVQELDRAIFKISRFEWIVFTSPNGVEMFFKRLRHLRKDSRLLKGLNIAAIGPSTRDKLNSYAIEPDLVPTNFTTAGLLAAFRHLPVQGKRFLLLRADIAPEAFRHALTDRGARVTEVAVYQTRKPANLGKRLSELVKNEVVDYVTFTSASTATHFFEGVGTISKSAGFLSKNAKPGTFGNGTRIISIGPATSKAIRAFGHAVDREAHVSTIQGIVVAILEQERDEISKVAHTKVGHV